MNSWARIYKPPKRIFIGKHSRTMETRAMSTTYQTRLIISIRTPLIGNPIKLSGRSMASLVVRNHALQLGIPRPVFIIILKRLREYNSPFGLEGLRIRLRGPLIGLAVLSIGPVRIFRVRDIITCKFNRSMWNVITPLLVRLHEEMEEYRIFTIHPLPNS